MIIIIYCFFRGAPIKMAIDHDYQSPQGAFQWDSDHSKLASEDKKKTQLTRLISDSFSEKFLFLETFLNTSNALPLSARLTPRSMSPHSGLSVWSWNIQISGKLLGGFEKWRLGGTPLGLCDLAIIGVLENDLFDLFDLTSFDSITARSMISLTRRPVTVPKLCALKASLVMMLSLRLAQRDLGLRCNDDDTCPGVVVQSFSPLRRCGSALCRPAPSASLRLAAPLDDVRCAGLTDVTPAWATADCCRGLVSDSDDVGYIDTHLHITKINDILHINLHSSFLINKAGQLMTDQCSQPFIILYDLNQPSSGQGLLTSLMTPPKSNKQET